MSDDFTMPAFRAAGAQRATIQRVTAPRTAEVSSRFTTAAKAMSVGLDAMALILGLLFARHSLLSFSLFFAFVVLVIQAPIWRAKEVFAEDAGLRVRGLRSEALVPYDQIEEVRKSARPGLVHLQLRCDTPVGRHIIFWAAWRFTRPALDLLRRRMKEEAGHPT